MTRKNVGVRRQTLLRRPNAAKNRPRPAYGLQSSRKQETICADSAFIWGIPVQKRTTSQRRFLCHLQYIKSRDPILSKTPTCGGSVRVNYALIQCGRHFRQ
jgi:hypothetical protein